MYPDVAGEARGGETGLMVETTKGAIWHEWVESTRPAQGFQRLITGVLPKEKTGENQSIGEGYNPAFTGVFTLMRRERRAPEAWATRRYVVSYHDCDVKERGAGQPSRPWPDGGLRPFG